MATYASYKDSGEQWLGQIPSHWEVKHLRNFLTIFSEKGYGDSQLLSVTREKGVILRDKDNKEENHNYVPEDLSGYKHLCAGDFVINKMKSWQGSYGVSDYEGIVSPAYYTCKLRGVDPQFFSRAIRSKAYIGYFMQYSKGIRVDQWDLDPNSMKSIPFILPPLGEQKTMVAYLDEATSQIDEAIAQQQHMIDLLNERKQIIIQNAVTKGLNPNVPMKASGIDWIGQIPASWEVKKLKYMCTYNDEVLAEDAKSGVIRYVEIGDVSFEDGIFNYTDYEFKEAPSRARRITRIGDVIISTVRTYLKAIAKIQEENLIVSTGFAVLRAKDVDPEFLAFALMNEGFVSEVLSRSYGVSYPAISAKELVNIPIAYPQREEQRKIVDFIEHDTYAINNEIKNIHSKIEMLKERKQIIVSEVVTGKVKVD